MVKIRELQKLLADFLLRGGGKKTLAVFVLLGCLPAALTLWGYYHHSMILLEKEISQSVLKVLDQTKNNVDFRMTMVSETVSGMMTSIHPYIDRDPVSDTLGQQIEDFRTISNLLAAYDKRSMIQNLRVFVPDEKLYARQHDTFFGLSELESPQTLLTLFHSGKSLVWLAGQGGGETEKGSIFCVSMTKKMDRDEFTAVLCASVAEEDVCALFELNLGYGEEVYLVSSGGQILSCREKSRLGEALFSQEEMEYLAGRGQGLLEDGQQITAFSRLDCADWYLAVIIPRAGISGAAQDSYGVSLLFAVSLLFLFLFLFMLFTYSSLLKTIMKKIHDMNRKIREEGIRALVPKKGEKQTVSALEENIDVMVDTIHELLEDSYNEKLKSRVAQLKALQTQINPHFLYNTLDTIKWMIMDGEREKSVSMVNSLSQYFRLSLNKGMDVISLWEECELCRTYLKIQQARFGSQLRMIVDLEEGTADCQIPKLTLQPIVENALLHGFREKGKEAGTVYISARLGRYLEIEVTDNGAGMDQEAARRILSSGAEGKGYGLANVQERIRLYYGGECGLSIQSRQGHGTKVTLRVRPMHRTFER